MEFLIESLKVRILENWKKCKERSSSKFFFFYCTMPNSKDFLLNFLSSIPFWNFLCPAPLSRSSCCASHEFRKPFFARTSMQKSNRDTMIFNDIVSCDFMFFISGDVRIYVRLRLDVNVTQSVLLFVQLHRGDCDGNLNFFLRQQNSRTRWESSSFREILAVKRQIKILHHQDH